MALKITDECTNCGACEPECPNEAISEGADLFVIKTDLCTECVGFFDTPQCNDVCPVECCVDDEDNKESESVLVNKARKIHPKKKIDEKSPSRYKE